MKYLLVLLFGCNALATSVDSVEVNGWGDKVTVIVQAEGQKYMLITSKDELEKYRHDKKSKLDDFLKEVKRVKNR